MARQGHISLQNTYYMIYKKSGKWGRKVYNDMLQLFYHRELGILYYILVYDTVSVQVMTVNFYVLVLHIV